MRARIDSAWVFWCPIQFLHRYLFSSAQITRISILCCCIYFSVSRNIYIAGGIWRVVLDCRYCDIDWMNINIFLNDEKNPTIKMFYWRGATVSVMPVGSFVVFDFLNTLPRVFHCAVFFLFFATTKKIKDTNTKNKEREKKS